MRFKRMRTLALLCAVTVAVSGLSYTVPARAEEPVQQTDESAVPAGKVVWSDDMGETLTSSNKAVNGYWENNETPLNWKGMWESVACPDVKVDKNYVLSMDEETRESGKWSVHYSAESNAGRFTVDFTEDTRIPVDFNKNYVLHARVRLENVELNEGTDLKAAPGFSIAFSTKDTAGATQKIQESRLTESTDGWADYIVPLNLSTSGITSQDNKAWLTMWFEYISGDIWIDSVELLEEYGLNVAEDNVMLDVGESHKMNVTCDAEGVDLSSLKYESSDEAVATVDSEGNITAVGAGTATITAALDETHKAECLVMVFEEGKNYFKTMYERCYKQTIGANPGEELPSDPYMDALVASLNDSANKCWETMNKSSDADREEIWPGIKPVVGYRPNTATADLTTTYTNLNTLAKAYATPGTDLYQNDEVPEEIFSAVDFTLEHDWYGSTTYNPYGNWWDHRIGVPAQLLPTMTVLRDEITDDQFDRYMTAMKNQKANDWSGYTAANKADIALNALYIAILEKDGAFLNKIKESLGEDMFSYTTGNGWHTDGSYIDHDAYAYTGGYGSAMISAMEKIIPLVVGTPFELKYGDERDTFYDEVIFNNYVPLHYAGRIFDMVSGRSITRVTTQGRQSAGQLAVFADALSEEKGAQLRSIIKQWLLQDDEIMGAVTKPSELAACINILNDDDIEPVNVPEGFYRYSDMDKYVQHTEDYTVALSMHSNKIRNYEFLNEEGRKLWNISDGALFLNNADVDQYKDNFWPTVNHLRMPGVTTLYQGDRASNAGSDSTQPNAWVAGVDMGTIGAAGMQIKTLGTGNAKDGLQAKKSYFMFDDEVVALGSGIQALTDTGLPAETVVENRKIKDDLSNKLTFNGKEVDVTDNSSQETVNKDQYVKIYTTSSGADNCHNITHALPEDAQNVTLTTTMRYNDSYRNAGVRIMGTDENGKSQKLFEFYMWPTQLVNIRTNNEDGTQAGKNLFTIPSRTEWWTIEASVDMKDHTLVIKATDASGKVLGEKTLTANTGVKKIQSFDIFTDGAQAISEFHFKTLNVTADGNDVIDLDFNETTAEEWTDAAGWKIQCVDSKGEVKENTCSAHDKYAVTTISNEVKTQARKGTEVEGVTWAHLEGNVEGSDIGYYFPEATDILAVKNERTGTWKEINDLKNWGHDDLPAYTRGYAELVIDHGVLTTDGAHADYSYVLLPGKSEAETEAYNNNPDVEILANTEAVHAVRENTLGVTALNCWTSQGAEAGGISVNTYASVMWKDNGDSYELVVCDADHDGKTPIELSIEGVKTDGVISKDDKITVAPDADADTLKLTVDVTGTQKSQQYKATFAKAVPETDKEELSSLIDEYSKIEADGYTAESYESFKAALDYAKEILEDAWADQETVDQAAADLKAAKEALEPVKTPDDGDNEDGDDEDKDDGGKTDGSVTDDPANGNTQNNGSAGSQNAAQTGDTATVWPVFAAVLISALAAAGTLIMRRRRR